MGDLARIFPHGNAADFMQRDENQPSDVLRGLRQFLTDRPVMAENVVFMRCEEGLDLGLPGSTPSMPPGHLRHSSPDSAWSSLA